MNTNILRDAQPLINSGPEWLAALVKTEVDKAGAKAMKNILLRRVYFCSDHPSALEPRQSKNFIPAGRQNGDAA